LVRRLICDRVGLDSDVDRASKLSVPPEDLAAMSVMLGNLTKVILASRELQDGQAGNVIGLMEGAHRRIMRIIRMAEV